MSCYLRSPAHDDVIQWKRFPRYWPFVWGIHRSPVNSPHKGQWCGALMFSLIGARINGWVNNREAGDLRRYRTHYDVIVMNVTFAACSNWQQRKHREFCITELLWGESSAYQRVSPNKKLVIEKVFPYCNISWIIVSKMSPIYFTALLLSFFYNNEAWRKSLLCRHNGRDSVSNHQPHLYSTVYSGIDQRKHQSSASLAFVQVIHRWPVNSPHKWPVTQKMFPFDDVIMMAHIL